MTAITKPNAATLAIDFEARARREKNKLRVLKFLAYTLLLAAALAYVMPFILSAISSFKTDADITRNPVKLTFDSKLGSPTLDGIRRLSKDSITFPRWMLNSVIVTVSVVAGRLVLASLAGYALARMRFRGRQLVFSMILLVMGIPHIVLAIPQFIVLKQIGVLNTYWAIILPMLFDCADILIMKQFMEQIPPEMEEAAALDGATRFQTFWKVVLPLASPGLLTLVILRTVGAWNEFLKVLIAIPSAPQLRTLPVGLATLQGGEFGSTTPWSTVLAGALLTTIPMAIIFFTFQRFFQQGLSASGVKG